MVEEVQFASWVVVVVGIWEILAPFVLGYSGSTVPTINAVVVGLIAVILAMIRALGAYWAAWMSWVTCALGFWLIIAPFLLGYGSPARVNDIIIGTLMAFFSVWGVLATEQVETI